MTLFYFDTFTHTLHVLGIYHPSSGVTLQIGAVGITTCNIIYSVLVYIVIVVNGFFRGKGELVSVIDIENWCVVLILMCPCCKCVVEFWWVSEYVVEENAIFSTYIWVGVASGWLSQQVSPVHHTV
jgi:hypothetical protein